MRRFLAPAHVLVGLVVSALLVVLLARAVDIQALSQALAHADLRPVPIAVAPFFIGVWLRSMRWRLLLPGAAVTTRNLFRVQVIGFAMALALALWRSDSIENLTMVPTRHLPARVSRPMQRLANGFAYGLTPLRNFHRLPVLLGLFVLGWPHVLPDR